MPIALTEHQWRSVARYITENAAPISSLAKKRGLTGVTTVMRQRGLSAKQLEEGWHSLPRGFSVDENVVREGIKLANQLYGAGIQCE